MVDVDFGAPVTGTPAPKKEEQPAAAKGGKTKGEKPGKASSKKDKKKGKKEKDTREYLLVFGSVSQAASQCWS